jgi:hypothetical protein
VDWWTYGRLAATGFVDRHALLAGAVVVFVEEAGVPLPMLPGDLVMLLLGVRARQGLVPLWAALAVLELATVAGATLLYALCRRAGRGVVCPICSTDRASEPLCAPCRGPTRWASGNDNHALSSARTLDASARASGRLLGGEHAGPRAAAESGPAPDAPPRPGSPTQRRPA